MLASRKHMAITIMAVTMRNRFNVSFGSISRGKTNYHKSGGRMQHDNLRRNFEVRSAKDAKASQHAKCQDISRITRTRGDGRGDEHGLYTFACKICTIASQHLPSSFHSAFEVIIFHPRVPMSTHTQALAPQRWPNSRLADQTWLHTLPCRKR